jgi:hypothetical protein
MSYSGYSRSEYASEVESILHHHYGAGRVAGRHALWDATDRAYSEGLSPSRAAQRVAWAIRARRKPGQGLGEGPQIKDGYADKNRVGSRQDWETVMVTASRLNPRARYLGKRNIDGTTMNVWKVGKTLYAQTYFGERDHARRSRRR